MSTEKPELLFILQRFLDNVYERASKSQSVLLKRNHGHYTYADEILFVYVTIFPKEVELVFESKQVSSGVFSIALDMCMSSGEVLAGDLLSLNGRCEEISAALASQEDWVLALLLKCLRN
ncbi:hypothetical protein [Pseudomonas danubii]|uniref:hypothetical protein n=1 Tax=Pseudomonas danubii TaxID=2497146 RepID=UPI0038578A55